MLIKHNILKPNSLGSGVDYLALTESASLGMCSLAVLLWMAIGSLSRTPESEILAQRVIAGICLASAALLFFLHYSGGEIWGSKNIARPFAVIAVIVALSSMMNIEPSQNHESKKGRRVSYSELSLSSMNDLMYAGSSPLTKTTSLTSSSFINE